MFGPDIAVLLILIEAEYDQSGLHFHFWMLLLLGYPPDKLIESWAGRGLTLDTLAHRIDAHESSTNVAIALRNRRLLLLYRAAIPFDLFDDGWFVPGSSAQLLVREVLGFVEHDPNIAVDLLKRCYIDTVLLLDPLVG